MKEITHSIFREAHGLLAGVPDRGRLSFFDRQGLESLILARRARAQDTGQLEDQLAVLTRAECWLARHHSDRQVPAAEPSGPESWGGARAGPIGPSEPGS